MAHARPFIAPLALALLLAAACNDGAMPSPPPPPPGRALGMLVGTIEGSDFKATYTPVAGGSYVGSVSPAIYGNQGTTVSVRGKVNSKVTVGSTTTWDVSVMMQNLEAFAIGSNFSDATSTLRDTMGVFLFFTGLPVVTLPAGCTCQVAVTNAMGTADFSATDQPYFWYKNRPKPFGSSPAGSDQTDSAHWTFKSTPTAGVDTAHAFTFVLMVNAAWSPPNETSWNVNYRGTKDSLPDTKAEPRWRTKTFLGTLDPASWTTAGLAMSAQNKNRDSFMFRNDSLGAMSAVMEVTVQLTKSAAGVPQAIFGMAEGPSPLKQMAIAVASDELSFADFDNASGAWSENGPVTAQNMLLAAHTLRLRKYAQDSAVLCVDGVRKLKRDYGGFVVPLQTTAAKLDSVTTFFGVRGSGGGAVSSNWTSVVYTLGANALPCT